MPQYEYRNALGETRTIYARMTDPPPEIVEFADTGEWKPCDFVRDENNEDVPMAKWPPYLYRRVYSNVQVQTDPVVKPFLSNSLPRNAPGVECAPDGRPIIKSRAHAKEVARITGYDWS